MKVESETGQVRPPASLGEGPERAGPTARVGAWDGALA